MNIDKLSVDTSMRANEDGGGGYGNAYYQQQQRNKQQDKHNDDRQDKAEFKMNHGTEKSLEQRLMELGAKYKAQSENLNHNIVKDGIYISRQVSPEALLEMQLDDVPNPFREQFEKSAIEQQAAQEQLDIEKDFDQNLFNKMYDKLLAEIYNKLYSELYSKLFAVFNSDFEDETTRLNLKIKGQKQYINMLEDRIDELQFQISSLIKK
jgi:hypothetical protein